MTFIIAPRGGIHPHLPVPLLDGMQTNSGIEVIIEPSRTLRDYEDMWDPGQPELGGYFLPPFQRPPVWSYAQQVRLVESLLLGVNIGSIVVVDAADCPMQSPTRFAKTDRWLLDGQQRIRALLAYRNDQVVPFAGTACAHRWSDLSPVEQRRVHNMQIGIVKIHTDDEAYCREIYNRLAFGGTPHTADQAA